MRRVLTLLLGISGLVSAEDKPCTAHAADGKYYDLNQFKGRKDADLKTPGGHTLSINVCQGVTTEIWGLKEDIKASEIAGLVSLDHGVFAIGKVNTTLTVVDSRPRLTLSEGSACKAKPGGSSLDLKASTIVEFVCDSSIFGAGQPRLVGQLPPGDDEVGCAYFIEWPTPFACPTSEDGGVWGFFAMLAVALLTLLLTYTVLGTLYNRYVLQLRGYDQIPQFSIESMKYHASEAMDWIKDILAAYNLPGGSRGTLPYASRAPHSATNPVSHHTQASEELNINQNTTFVRPQAPNSRPPPRPDVNPVSHHAQMEAEIDQTRPSPLSLAPAPPPKQSLSQFTPRRVDLGSRGPTQEEREFIMGEEDAEEYEWDGEEMDDKSTPVTSTARPSHAESSSPSGEPSQLNRGTANIAAIRGRDTGEGKIRL
ncbi:hypothetical protein NP233_g3690 [Leucocoprinus birnbaumii]|uniref:Autophagy-related protein 27 n=1 Tax=Leucocoprinus birnbaumii TaxID=56174 RepID=A0AAD5VWR5_9AGAR|nr:hypothetical protein NP233_g3690 [Leucocoprinus birnbaumii]